MKKAFKLASLASFGIAKCLYFSQIAQFSQKFQVLAGNVRWWHVQSAVHVTTRLIWPAELTRSTTFVSKISGLTRVRHDSIGVKTSNASRILCGSLLILSFFLKICQIVICPATGKYNHVQIFLCSRMKKAFKLASRASFKFAKCLYLFQFAQFSQKFQFFSCTCHGSSSFLNSLPAYRDSRITGQSQWVSVLQQLQKRTDNFEIMKKYPVLNASNIR